jgi:thiol-disulfide isomerase/thioredoxin
MKILILIFLFLNLSCSKTENQLLPLQANDLQNIIDQYKGEKNVLVNFWATWCKPCIIEFPDIVKLKNENSDLEVIFISFDFEGQEEIGKKFLVAQKVNFTTYIKAGSDQDFYTKMPAEWTGAIPFTFIINKKGEIKFTATGIQSFNTLKKQLVSVN